MSIAQRKSPRRPLLRCVALVVALALGACERPAPQAVTAPPAAPKHGIPMVDVTRIDLGTSVAADGTIPAPTAAFGPHDTIHAAVTTQRPGHGIVLKVRWSFQEAGLIREQTRTIDPTDTLVTDFDLTNDAGWPPGVYRIDVLVNDVPAAMTQFIVHR